MSGLLPATSVTRANLRWVALKHQSSIGSPWGHRRAHAAPLNTRTPQIIPLTARGRCKSHQVKGRRIVKNIFNDNKNKHHEHILQLRVTVSAPLPWHSGGWEVVTQSRGSCNFYRLLDPTPPSIPHPSYTLVLRRDCASGGL